MRRDTQTLALRQIFPKPMKRLRKKGKRVLPHDLGAVVSDIRHAAFRVLRYKNTRGDVWAAILRTVGRYGKPGDIDVLAHKHHFVTRRRRRSDGGRNRMIQTPQHLVEDCLFCCLESQQGLAARRVKTSNEGKFRAVPAE